MTPEQLRGLPVSVHAAAVEAFSMSIHTMFIWVIPVAAVGFLLTWLLRDVPLREYTAVVAERPEPTPAPDDPPRRLAEAG